jgi:hypothetical protein
VGRPHGGIAQAARVLCVPGKTEEARRKSIERAMKIAEICPEAKDEAKRLGLEDNQSALLAIANVTPEEQVAKAQERAARKRRRRHKQTITSDHVKEGTSPPVSTEEDGAHPRASPEEVEGQETEFERLTAAWAAASNAVRQRFVIEVVEQFGRSNVAA